MKKSDIHRITNITITGPGHCPLSLDDDEITLWLDTSDDKSGARIKFQVDSYITRATKSGHAASYVARLSLADVTPRAGEDDDD